MAGPFNSCAQFIPTIMIVMAMGRICTPALANANQRDAPTTIFFCSLSELNALKSSFNPADLKNEPMAAFVL